MKMNPVRKFARCFCYSTALLAAASLSTNSSNAGLALETVVDSGIISPMALAPIDSSTMLLTDQGGFVLMIKDGELVEEPVLDLREKLSEQTPGFEERGLLGLALHPDFAENKKFYVYYSAPGRESMPEGWNHTSHVSEFQMSADDPEKADPDSERIILQIDEPQATHNCGRLAFGPDGYLYIGVGDGGGANDGAGNINPGFRIGHSEGGNAQDIMTPLGKILRIDVNGDPFDIPSDNPFVGTEGHDAIFAYGIRNPWGMTFDMGGDHELFVADVGQSRFEEVNIITKGGNYGWRLKEGAHGFDPFNVRAEAATNPTEDANGNPLIEPIVEYKNMGGFRRDPEALGISITGGYVYRGKAIPELDGKYIFGDWSQSFALPRGVLLAAGKDGDTWSIEKLALDDNPEGIIDVFIMAFGQDLDGEVYILGNKSNGLYGITNPDRKQGVIYKLVKTE